MQRQEFPTITGRRFELPYDASLDSPGRVAIAKGMAVAVCRVVRCTTLLLDPLTAREEAIDEQTTEYRFDIARLPQA